MSLLESMFQKLSIPFTQQKINIPKGIYTLTEPIDILQSDTVVDGNGSTIIWEGNNEGLNNTNRLIGMFNVKGSLTSTKKNITSFNLNLGFNTQGGYVILDSLDGLSSGDSVVLDIKIGEYDANKLNPKVSLLTKILDIVDSKVFLEYANPFTFPATFKATLTKVNTTENVTIKNFYIIDNAPLQDGWVNNANTQYPNYKPLVSGVSLQYTRGCTVENVRGLNTKFPLVMANYTAYTDVLDVHLDKPALVAGGEGYLVQFNSSTYCKAIDCTGNKARHVVDFTYSAYGTVKHCKGFSTASNAFQLHGAYEHDITFEDCIGNFGSYSGEQFGNATKNVSFTRHKGTFTGGGYSLGYTVRDSSIDINGTYTDITIIDSYTTSYKKIYKAPDKRGEALVSRIIFRGGELKLTGSQTVSILDVYDYVRQYDMYPS